MKKTIVYYVMKKLAPWIVFSMFELMTSSNISILSENAGKDTRLSVETDI